MEVTIREGSPQDAAQLISHIQRATAEPGIDLVFEPGEFNFSVEEEQRWIRSHVDSNNSIVLVAEADGKIVGVLTCMGGARKAVRHNTLLGITVDKEWRDQGVGRALMTGAIEWAKNTGIIRRIELEVFARNARAIHLYRKMGFEVEGRRRRAMYKGREYIDVLIMALLL